MHIIQSPRLSLSNHYPLPLCSFKSPHTYIPSFSPAAKVISISGFSNSLKRVPKSQSAPRRNSSSGLMDLQCCRALVGEETRDDAFYIRRCVEIARKAIGCTTPNPMVGCVIVKDGQIVGEGFHPKAGQPHAEVFALRDAGELAENATAYVSLEPCNHYGRTPPCTEALINAKVKKVVVGMVDPNPIVASKGLDKLRGVGIDVTVGVEQELCKRLNEAYIHKMLTGNPFLTIRYSISLNGNILDRLGEGAVERGGYYSRLLQEYDGVVLSASSTANELSLPISQESGANQPLWIITATSPYQVLVPPVAAGQSDSRVIVFADKECSVESSQRGIETVVLDHINLNAILEYCKQQGLCSVLLDLRGTFSGLEKLVKEAMEHKMLQKIIVEVLPVWEGEVDAGSVAALKTMGRHIDLKNVQASSSDRSIVLEGYF
ncbi:unnamed protein product [Linum tenue]|uniref:Riboflavin biosynthesis protein PYRD, chloroplastic n=1 Tax=Linum tenue TaxID=586396 RepID=A0AAV0RWS8_9ROSI|nr:unnamed protein product [Linum tenue]